MHPYEKNIQVLDMNSNDNDSRNIKKNIIDNNHNIDNNIDDILFNVSAIVIITVHIKYLYIFFIWMHIVFYINFFIWFCFYSKDSIERKFKGRDKERDKVSDKDNNNNNNNNNRARSPNLSMARYGKMATNLNSNSKVWNH